MQIDALRVSLRARTPWESIDLGVALARETGWRLFAPYAVLVFAVGLVLQAIAFLVIPDTPEAAIWVLWWLKPLFDRVALHVLSQSVFGAPPTIWHTLTHLREISWNRWLHSLTLGRFDLARSFHLPVAQLEGQRGKAARERIKLLDKRSRGHAVWLTIAVVHFAYVLIFGLDFFIGMFVPDGVQFRFSLRGLFSVGEEAELMSRYFFVLAYLIAECVLEPFYVAAGFSLYLNRRSALEAWDLEIAFKRMGTRMARVAGRALPMILVGMLFLSAQSDVWAQTDRACTGGPVSPAANLETLPRSPPTNGLGAVDNSTAKKQTKENVEALLKTPEFNESEVKPHWRERDRGKRDEDRGNRGFSPGFYQFMEQLFRVLGWMLAIALIGFLIAMVVKNSSFIRTQLAPRARTPEVMFGLDLRPESLPDDVAQAAREAAAGGDVRLALSLLYRGALARLVSRGLELSASDTEGECARRVNAQHPSVGHYFDGLVAAWAQVAYARSAPAKPVIDTLIAQWPANFSKVATPEAAA